VKEQTLTVRLPGSILRWIDRERGDMELSAYLARVLERHMQQAREQSAAREAWLAEGRRQYTPEVCQQTLTFNEEFPIHEE
jgi:hypothetical protein